MPCEIFHNCTKKNRKERERKKRKTIKGERKKKDNTVSKTPKKEKKTTSPTCDTVTRGKKKPYRKVRQFYCLGDGESHLPCDRETIIYLFT